MNRRDFLLNASKVGIIAGSGLINPIDIFAKNEYVKLTILHTNDTHSRIEAFPNDGRKYAGMGGIAQRAALVSNIRKQEKNVLLLDAGDIFQGTPYFNFFGGELEFKMMSKMNYDAATLGNHDFDNGLNGLMKMLPHAKFPFVNANYNFNQTQLKGRFKPYTTFEKESVKVGVFGLGVELDGLVSKKLSGDTVYNDPIDVAQSIVKELRETEKCDLVICLSHLGYSYNFKKVSDQVLAANVDGIDLIIGGHTHTFLNEPTRVASPSGKEVLINQVGWAGINLGRIDFYFSHKKDLKFWESSSLKIVDNMCKTT